MKYNIKISYGRISMIDYEVKKKIKDTKNSIRAWSIDRTVEHGCFKIVRPLPPPCVLEWGGKARVLLIRGLWLSFFWLWEPSSSLALYPKFVFLVWAFAYSFSVPSTYFYWVVFSMPGPVLSAGDTDMGERNTHTRTLPSWSREASNLGLGSL